jgi:hypothetical protein
LRQVLFEWTPGDVAGSPCTHISHSMHDLQQQEKLLPSVFSSCTDFKVSTDAAQDRIGQNYTEHT